MARQVRGLVIIKLRIGANFQDGSCSFSVWAPHHNEVTLLIGEERQQFKMMQAENGYWALTCDGMKPNSPYLYKLDGKVVKPDPASHFQPTGVFGPSAVIDHEAFKWSDDGWSGLDLEDLVFYELHVGTFTPEGTFKSLMSRIKELSEFGVNAVELMPVSQFSGSRNWGYDGVFPFAVQNSYGNPDDLKMLVDECHFRKVALFIDLVYNHVGPEGNCLNDYGPYFPSSSKGRWGPNVNLDGTLSSEVRNYFLENTLHWFSHYHLDGIRLDAVLTIHDNSQKHFLQELNQAVKSYSKQTGKKLHLVAELGGCNEPKVLTPIQRGGFGFDAQWLEDFQHALFVQLTGEKKGYYQLYTNINDLIESITDAYVYIGNDLDSKRRSSDESFLWIPSSKFIVFSQNHDQIGNRLLGDRLISITGFEGAKLAIGMVMLSPYIPLFFMGEEYGETAPFLFFTDYSNNELKDAVREGRKKEFADFHWQGEVPDPQSLETFDKSKINWNLRSMETGKKMAGFFKTLIEIRKNLLLFHSNADRQIKQINAKNEKILFIKKENENSEAVIIANFTCRQTSYLFPFENGTYKKILDSAEVAWNGPGPSLPISASYSDSHVIQGFNFAVFLKSTSEEGDKIG